jgi:hypothetical protein
VLHTGATSCPSAVRCVHLRDNAIHQRTKSTLYLRAASYQLEEDAIEAYCFEQLAADKCWIGLNDLQDEGHFVFTDATPYNYTRWCAPSLELQLQL